MRTERSRRGQAMIEMAIGMLVFALVLGGLLAFGEIIPESMRLQSIVRRLAGSTMENDACNIHCNATGSADGAPLPNLDYVLGEPEVRPVTMTGPFSDSSKRPLEFRTQALNFSIRIEPGTADWIWGGETKFRGVEECHMPTMKIPEFAVEGVVQ